MEEGFWLEGLPCKASSVTPTNAAGPPAQPECLRHHLLPFSSPPLLALNPNLKQVTSWGRAALPAVLPAVLQVGYTIRPFGFDSVASTHRQNVQELVAVVQVRRGGAGRGSAGCPSLLCNACFVNARCRGGQGAQWNR